ncbi:MAG: hypothetical protein HN742_15010 [Lentisphaerae bacterium]|jgi:hypothetical protein|nr:hypothetical protein [Lentisphaerota bacterium]MBT7057768.1 hypothetical protein [Lentisphaerota bacterium]MBT7843187.1 hypothetical protein [Lentisphaerota bacterium]
MPVRTQALHRRVLRRRVLLPHWLADVGRTPGLAGHESDLYTHGRPGCDIACLKDET